MPIQPKVALLGTLTSRCTRIESGPAEMDSHSGSSSFFRWIATESKGEKQHPTNG